MNARRRGTRELTLCARAGGVEEGGDDGLAVVCCDHRVRSGAVVAPLKGQGKLEARVHLSPLPPRAAAPSHLSLSRRAAHVCIEHSSMQYPAVAAPTSASTSTVPAPSTSSSSALSITKEFKPYYPPTTVIHLVRLQSVASSRSSSSAGLEGAAGGRKELSETRVEGLRQLACGYIERVGARLGL